MKNLMRIGAGLLAGLCLVAVAPAQPPTAEAAREETVMSRSAKGTFEVKLAPLPQDGGAEDSHLGRMSIDKTFHGDLEGTSRGQMLTAMTPVDGSAGYVAVEKVTGTLDGRSGSFVLQHNGTMSGGEQRLTITVVPDSGTGELAGVAGSMTIEVRDGEHSYELAYTLPEGA